MACTCSAKGQCNRCREVDLYNAGFRAGQIGVADYVAKQLEVMNATVEEISSLMKKGEE